ncbi:MAG TPA: FlgD immunoglobulin-like domain containing protein [Candidatus Krumholzibacteria bacterium]|nr:FlgD immunoglobulin-like domain containing protein [Candidatus Krumholzibacteria bacterium]
MKTDALLIRLAGVALAVLVALPASAAHAAKTAFRLTDLDWRDPHLFAVISTLGCTDITNFNAFGVLGMNPSLQNSIQTDTDSDGNLDLNLVIVFDPLDQAGSGGTLAFGAVTCSAPLGTTACAPYSPLPLYAYDNTPAVCLTAIAGTTNAAYTPALVTPGSPCFVAALGNITLDLPFPLSLSDAYIAATYSGDPAVDLVNGLLCGFLSETVADNTIPPPSMGVVGGAALSSLLRGGTGSCSQPSPATGDKDTGPGGIPGWYVYLNFTATVVPYTDPVTGASPAPMPALELYAPAPNPFNPATAIRYALSRESNVALSVYDARGRLVAQLERGDRDAGEHVVRWDGRDAHGAPVSSGVYFVRLESRGDVRVRKIVLLK